MTNFFTAAAPETVGIASEWLENFLTRLEAQQLPIHSAIIMRHDQICLEAYYKPYTRESLHRMFSMTKSFVSLAVGLLEADGKLSLDDSIVDYFPEKQPENGAYEYTKMTTIRDMLTMTSCHNQTTYKAAGVTDWVGSFFTIQPTHVPGTNFSYDTSASHVLGALVEKLSGKTLLDYLREKCLDTLEFSREAFVLKDPNGISMGGSGLCATPMDILKTLYLVAHDGEWQGRQLLPKAYIRDAKSKLRDTYGKSSAMEEQFGYGYQIWQSRNNGFMFFGMGGQLALYVPEKDIFMVTTADAQGRQGGVQLIYDAFWEEIYSKITAEALPADPAASEHLKVLEGSRELFVMPGPAASTLLEDINDVIYVCGQNDCGVTEISLHFNADLASGELLYTNTTGPHALSFSVGRNTIGLFPDYGFRYAASGAWRMDDFFLLRVQIIDSAIGSIYIGLNFKKDYITVMFRKIEESLFTEYDGVFSGMKKE